MKRLWYYPRLILIPLFLTSGLLVFASGKSIGAEAPLTRPKVGLVLSGGGARGAAHIGVLKILEQQHIAVDYIAGTSMGAVVGGLYASGLSPEEIEKEIGLIDWKDIFSDAPTRQELPFRRKNDAQKYLTGIEIGVKGRKIALPKGIMAGQKLGFLLKSLTLHTADIDDFDRLPIPFRAIAADIETGKMVILSRGNFAEALRASMSIPGVFSPVEIDGQLLVDGGIARNLPVDVVKQMGADVVIAVDIGSTLSKREDLNTMFDIYRQVLTVMGQQNVVEQIKLIGKDDCLIRPELGNISTADFPRALEIIRIGEEAALNSREALQRYAVSPEEYQSLLKRRFLGVSYPVSIDFVKVKETKHISGKVVENKLKTKPGENLNLKTLQDDLARVYGIGAFERVDFSFIKDKDKQGLLISPTEKSWGPNYLYFGMRLSDDLQGMKHNNLLFNYNMTQINPLGAEWQTQLQIGNDGSLSSEFFQPLDYSGRLFLIPRFETKVGFTEVYNNGKRESQYQINSTKVGLDVGAELGTYGEVRFGVEKRNVGVDLRVGSAVPKEDSGNQAALVGSFAFDHLDNSNFPRYGAKIDLDFILARSGLLGGEISYDKVIFSMMDAVSYRKHTFLASLEGGTSLNSEIPFYDQFILGGFFSLSGYREGELRGNYYGLARIIYFYRFGKLPFAWGENLYLGGSVEAGKTWISSKEIELSDLLWSGSLLVGADTPLGPLYFGYGFAEETDGVFYVYLGRKF
ncbi:MAG: patatin-like phospholipase family protein [Candidatus Omnitrophica bacterium]|nr:patatin-like phospholipase family protein [Candidatus Omnitrophota bacterium]